MFRNRLLLQVQPNDVGRRLERFVNIRQRCRLRPVTPIDKIATQDHHALLELERAGQGDGATRRSRRDLCGDVHLVRRRQGLLQYLLQLIKR